MVKRAKKYHHGDLRNQIIDASAKMIGESGLESLSLRRVAESAGVSHNAPYMHFDDKEALLAGVAESGFSKLTEAFPPVLEKLAEEDWHTRFHGGCMCYVSFALENPGYLQTMFRRYDQRRFPSLLQRSLSSIMPLLDVLEEGKALGRIKDNDTQSMASAVWALLHGVSMLLLHRDGIPTIMGEENEQQLVAALLEHLLYGLRKN